MAPITVTLKCFTSFQQSLCKQWSFIQNLRLRYRVMIMLIKMNISRILLLLSLYCFSYLLAFVICFIPLSREKNWWTWILFYTHTGMLDCPARQLSYTKHFGRLLLLPSFLLVSTEVFSLPIEWIGYTFSTWFGIFENDERALKFTLELRGKWFTGKFAVEKLKKNEDCSSI